MTTTQGVASQTDTPVLGGAGEILQPEQVREFVATAVAGAGLENQRVCLVVPDGTRTCPLPLLLQAMREALASASQVEVIIALGTHQGMSDEHLARHLGYNRRRMSRLWSVPFSARGGGALGGQQVFLPGGLWTGIDQLVALGWRLDHQRGDDRDACITPVRALIDEAASMIPARRLALCLVVASGTDTLLTPGRRGNPTAVCRQLEA